MRSPFKTLDKSFEIKRLTIAALIAAVYAAVTMLLQAISYGPIQMRVSEALTLLPILFPEAVPGLFVGCLIANLISAYGLPDIIFGSLATLAAAMLTRRLRKNMWLAALPPVLINAVFVGILLRVQINAPLLPTMFTVGVGEAVSVYALGIAMILGLRKLSPLLARA
ncbi:MAG: QueT transporter family protein [Oscillospiraceae bacterium]|jgi:uncharacterized membrane protein|nr:QueT transporter family protein [Oscillospiraceae bacterium]